MSINPKPAARRSGNPVWRSPAGRVALVVGTLMLAAAVLPAARIMLVGLAPTLIAYLMSHLIDRSGDRHSVLCIGICNLAGLVPFAVVAFKAPGGVAGALDDSGVILALLAAYGSAALGWLIYRVTPAAYGRLLRLRAEHRLGRIGVEQDALVAEWGDEIAAPEAAKPERE
jgi:hypothetical protein